MSIFEQKETNSSLSQLIYALVVIILIPTALALNTFYLLHNVHRDLDFELNNKALLVSNVFSLTISDFVSDKTKLETRMKDLIKLSPEIKAISVFVPKGTELERVQTTSTQTKAVTDTVLNQLAWTQDQAISKQIFATVGGGSAQRIWLVASTYHNADGTKAGLINLYLSAEQIDAISSRTVSDSLIVLVVTMIFIILLLLNHFRFYETSLLFKKLREVDKLKDDFISIASHELKTPLTAINGYIYILLKDPAINASESLKKNITVITQSVNRLKIMVDDILDISRIEQGRMKFELKQNNIADITARAVNELFPQAEAKGLKLAYDPPPKALLITCDQDRLLQVMINLIGNAIKYTPTGEVHIYHDLQPKFVRTLIKDTGVGISEENRVKLFQKFSRIYNDKTATVTGTGLGLWITKQIVEKMNGKISVESIQDQGSVFIVTFPLTA